MELKIWRWTYGYGDMDMEMWIWRYGVGYIEIEIWRDIDIEMEI